MVCAHVLRVFLLCFYSNSLAGTLGQGLLWFTSPSSRWSHVSFLQCFPSCPYMVYYDVVSSSALSLGLGICISVVEGCQQPRLALSTTWHDGRSPDSSLDSNIVLCTPTESRPVMQNTTRPRDALRFALSLLASNVSIIGSSELAPFHLSSSNVER